jgi:MFS family permease
MSEGSTASGGEISSQDKILFWGCFIALITTAFGFIARMFLINTWADQFGLDGPEAGRLAGIGIWPFAASIIGFSLVIDRIGYKAAAIFAFVGHAVWAVMGVSAFFVAETDRETAYALLYWGSLILALGNGAVEAFINPVVATMFSREKTKWLNILHAGWPGGLVIAGVLTILLGDVDWWVRVGVIAIPAVVYLVMLLPCKFPENERVESGVTYKDMLSEFGVLGAAIVGVLVALQLMDFFKPPGDNAVLDPGLKYMFIGIGVAIVAAFGVYTRALGRPLMFILVLIMMPLATTEIGTDGWITGIMEGVFQMTPEEVAAAGGEENVLMIGGKAFKMHPGWVLVQTSLIMMVLRFFAGPIIHRLSPLGLLTLSAVLAIVGLYTLSFTSGMMIFVAATIYALGKTFFWPTMLGVVSEQTPKGGALTLNAISGIGMLAVGTLGFPYIGALQADKEIQAVAASQVASEVPGLVKDGKVVTLTDKSIYEVIKYQAIDNGAVDKLVSELPEAKQAAVSEELSSIRKNSSQGALANMAIFPVVMLIGYILLMMYFKSKGGYKAVELDGGDG